MIFFQSFFVIFPR